MTGVASQSDGQGPNARRQGETRQPKRTFEPGNPTGRRYADPEERHIALHEQDRERAHPLGMSRTESARTPWA
jgi:hypothetical protein